MTTLGSYVNALRELSSTDLTRSIENLSDEERRRTVHLIAHLAEVSRRGLHLDLGCTSLHQYCVQRLGLSDGLGLVADSGRPGLCPLPTDS